LGLVDKRLISLCYSIFALLISSTNTAGLCFAGELIGEGDRGGAGLQGELSAAQEICPELLLRERLLEPIDEWGGLYNKTGGMTEIR
jgi:hypothetical protein